VSAQCTTAGCSRPASDKYAGLCANCYGTAAANASPPRHVVGAAEQLLTHVGGPGPGSASCIMDFCSNVGSPDCKGLCQQCFSALCQTRLQTAFDPPTSALPSTAHCTSNTHVDNYCYRTHPTCSSKPAELRGQYRLSLPYRGARTRHNI